MFFKILDSKVTQEDFVAYVSCESLKFCTVFLPLKFCVIKEKGLINPVSCLNMNVTVLKCGTLEFLRYGGEVVRIVIGSPAISCG